MKPLEELGISPTPWKVVPYGISTEDKRPTVGDVEDATGESMLLDFPTHANACMLGAAPKLYKAVYELLEIVCDDCQSRVVPISENRCTVCPRVKRARAALAEAAGESEVK